MAMGITKVRVMINVIVRVMINVMVIIYKCQGVPTFWLKMALISVELQDS